MKTTIEDLLNRRCVRSYENKPVPEEILAEVLKAGTYAPSGMNCQSAIILAVTNKEVRDKLSKANAAVMNSPNDPFYGAPVVLAVLSDKNARTHVYDGTLVMGNLLNAAYALGLGCCWIHRCREVFEKPEWKEFLKQHGITGDYEGIGFCILGYASGPEPEPAPRKANYIYRVK